jgi:hypothetical protein
MEHSFRLPHKVVSLANQSSCNGMPREGTQTCTCYGRLPKKLMLGELKAAATSLASWVGSMYSWSSSYSAMSAIAIVLFLETRGVGIAQEQGLNWLGCCLGLDDGTVAV